jgi:hypothetical protein
VQLTKRGNAGDPAIVVDATAILGADAAEFSDDFNDAVDVTLAPGEFTTVVVSFDPTSAGAKSATLEVTHSGLNTPLSIPLSGTGTTPPPPGAVHRVNAGGPALPGWTEDSAASPSPFVNAAATGNSTSLVATAIDLTHPSVPAGTPEALFQAERWDGAAAPEMQWDLPVTPGEYEVRLYFAETYIGAQAVGARVFDVSIEGVVALNNYDVFAAAGGGNIGIVATVVVTSDANLDIDFGHVVENPAIKAIEVIAVPPTPNELAASPTGLAFGSVLLGGTGTATVDVTNTGGAGDPSITISSTTIVGPNAGAFGDDFDDVLGATLAPGASTTITVNFNPVSAGAHSATLEITHSGVNAPLAIPLSGDASVPPPDVTYRINAGGPALAGTPGWAVDSSASPSPLVNAAATGNTTSQVTTTIDLRHASVPAGTPGALFQSERWDGPTAPEMEWDLPVAAGNYEVRLYFAETYIGAQSIGARLFDVYIEGALALDDYDVFAAAGGGNIAIVEAFTVTSDANLDIDFGHVAQNPMVKAIEVIALPPSPNELGASPAAALLGSVVVGQPGSTATVRLANLGGPGDPSIVVDATTISGANAADFSDDFNDAATVTVAPGTFTTVIVTFNPSVDGAEAATLEVTHSGSNTPLLIPLSGTGVVPPTGVIYRLNAGGPALADAPLWDVDTKLSPSPFVNALATGNKTFSTTNPIDLGDPSLPAGIPEALFQTERWDKPGGAAMHWALPVIPGNYEVRLYFAEIYSGAQFTGARLFDVSIEGALVLDDYDVFARVGPNAGVVETFVVATDWTLNIDFAHVLQNPMIKGIEVIGLGP